MKKLIILGGGLSGMVAADKLKDKFEITLIEKNDYLGGLAASFKHNGFMLPKYYHQVFAHDNITKSLLKSLKITDLEWKKINMGICWKNKIYNFTDILSLLRFKPLSLWGRIRYGLFGLYVFTFMNPDKINDMLDAESWLLPRAGREVTKKLFNILYARNKFNIPLNMISARQFAHRLKAREAMGYFGYPRKGLQQMVDLLEKKISSKVRIIKKISITKIDFGKKELYFGKKKMKFDLLLNTMPVPEFLKIARGLPADYVNQLSNVKYCPAVCVAFATDKHLSEHYWLNLLDEKPHTLFQHSRLYDGYPFKFHWILRYGGSEQDLDKSDKRIEESYLDVVKRYFPGVKILWSKVFKEVYGEPVYDKNYASIKPDYKSPLPFLYWAGVAVTYPKIRNMNTAIESGLVVAKIINNSH